VFVFGNKGVGTEDEQLAALAFPRLMALHSPHIHIDQCEFSLAQDMLHLEENQLTEASKEGSGRVAIMKETGCPFCFTIEAHFCVGKKVFSTPPAANDSSGRATPPQGFLSVRTPSTIGGRFNSQ
jgi:hypothetical protein